jgi:hypothetical protein
MRGEKRKPRLCYIAGVISRLTPALRVADSIALELAFRFWLRRKAKARAFSMPKPGGRGGREVLDCRVVAVIIVILHMLRSVSHHEVAVFPLNLFLLSIYTRFALFSFSVALKVHTNSSGFHDVLLP